MSIPILGLLAPQVTAAEKRSTPTELNTKKQQIRELLIEEALPQKALDILKPLLASHPNDPELWIYASATYHALGNQEKSSLYELKFTEWAKTKQTTSNPKVWIAFLKHLQRRNSECLSVVNTITEDSMALARLSNLDKKILFWTIGSAVCSSLTYYSSNREELLLSAISYLEKSLEINYPQDPPFNNFINYRCHFLLARAYSRLASYQESGEGKTSLYQKAVENLGQALRIKPNAWRTCMEWKALIQEAELPNTLPVACHLLYPSQPPIIK